MPELPEVETIRRGLEQEAIGCALQDVHVHEQERLLRNCTPGDLKRRLVGVRLRAVGRKGKFLVFDFHPHAVVLHLRMSGRLLLKPAQHTRLRLDFGPTSIFLDDARRFAMLYLGETACLEELRPIRDLGIDPLSPEYEWEAFARLLRSKQEIKRLLLDQHKIAGLGNIYASESLFWARVHPVRPAEALSTAAARALYRTIPRVLTEAIEAGGTTFRSYQMPSGELGRFQHDFCVYGREGAPCRRCGATIERIAQGGRSSFLCPQCQRA